MKKFTASQGVGSNYKRVTVFAESRSDAIKRAIALLGSRKGLSVVCAGQRRIL